MSRRLVAWTLLLAGVALAGLLARPLGRLAWTAWRDVGGREPVAAGFLDDASRMNRTPIAEIWSVPRDDGEAERGLAELLRRARREGKKVSIAGARHSMGGQSLYPGGIVVDMLPHDRLELDESADVLRAQAGARWSEVLPFLDRRGRSVGVMQSNNSFSVGGSVSVNCHGWTYGRPPIASTVASFRIMKADGTVARCSRTENAELFSLALGGYGLFGILLDVDLRVVPNERYRLKTYVVTVEDSLETIERAVLRRPEAAMAYARLSVVPESFLREALITVFERDAKGEVPALTAPGLASLRRAIFRGSVGSDRGKRLRWEAETRLQPLFDGKAFSRNQLLDEDVSVLQERAEGSTEILHESFVPVARAGAFVGAAREIVPRHGVELLNVTVRSVEADRDSWLSYAPEPMWAFVFLFHLPRTPEEAERLGVLTRELIDATLAHGGRFYLPYRLDATPEQLLRAYPKARSFFEWKRAYDPDELLQNHLYAKYAKP